MSHTKKSGEWNKSFLYTDEEIMKIGEKHFLTGEKLKNFFDYVKARNFIRKDYYIEEWADRFRNDTEWKVSDSTGQAILKKLSPRYKEMKEDY